MRKRNRSPDNIFRSSTVDDECRLLNNKCIQPCICHRDAQNNIIKYFTSNDVYQWESSVYVSMVDKNIFPLVTPHDKQLTYVVKDMVSLRTYLQTKKPNVSHTLNELFGYIRTLRTYKFLHGNLHIDNIFLNPRSFSKRAHFFVIDYANSYVLKRHSQPIGQSKQTQDAPTFKRTSFMGEYESKTINNNHVYWDILTVYVSLKGFFKKNPENVHLLDKLVTTVIDKDKLQELLKYYYEPKGSFKDGLPRSWMDL